MRKIEVRFWKNDQIEAQVQTGYDDLNIALGMFLNEPGWADARDWPQLGDGDSVWAIHPYDQRCFIEAVVIGDDV